MSEYPTTVFDLLHSWLPQIQHVISRTEGLPRLHSLFCDLLRKNNYSDSDIINLVLAEMMA